MFAYGEAAETWPDYMGNWVTGRYVVIKGEEHEGAAVYKNSRGKYLYKLSNGTWHVGDKIGAPSKIRSVDTAECPTVISQWEYYTGNTNGWSSSRIQPIQWCKPGGTSLNGLCSAGGHFCIKK